MGRGVFVVISSMISGTFGALLVYASMAQSQRQAKNDLVALSEEVKQLRGAHVDATTKLTDLGAQLERCKRENDSIQTELSAAIADLERCRTTAVDQANHLQREAPRNAVGPSRDGDAPNSKSIPYQLATIQCRGIPQDDVVKEFRTRLDRIAMNCPDDTRQQIGDVSVKAWQILSDKGISLDLASVMRELETATSNGQYHDNNDFAATTAVWLVVAEQLYGEK